MMHLSQQKSFRQVFILATLLTVCFSSGQVICSNPITGQNPSISNPYATGQITADHISANGIGLGPEVTGNAGVDKYTATFWTPSATAVVAGEYFEFVITPDDGYKINFTDFLFSCQRSSTGPVNGVLRSSLDNFTANIMSFNIAMAVTGQSADLSAELYQNITTPITFRIYEYGAPSNGGTGISSINDYTFNGSVLSIAPQIEAPVAIAATDISTIGFMANWETVPGATGYRLDVSGDENFTTILEDYNNLAVAGLSQFVTIGVLPDTPYYYRVRAEQEALVSVNSNTINLITPECNLAVPSAEPQSFCNTAAVEDLVPTGAEIKWYSEETGGDALANDEVLSTGVYYVAQFSGNCESARTEVSVNIIVPQQPNGSNSQDFTAGEMLSDLEVEGENISWYAEESLTTALPEDTLLDNGVTYYAVASEGICMSEPLAVLANLFSAPVATIATDISTIGFMANWDAVPGATGYRLDVSIDDNFITMLDSYNNLAVSGLTQSVTTGVQPNTTYYYRVRAEQEALLSADSNTIAVETEECNLTAPSATAQSFCNAATVQDLLPSEPGIKWYSEETGGDALADDEILSTGVYYVAQFSGNCESTRTEVSVNIIVPQQPTGNNSQDFTAGEMLSDLEVEGENISWYAEESLTTALPEDTLLADGVTYYAVASEGICMSEPLAVLANLFLGIPGIESGKFLYYPNPVNGILTVVSFKPISSVLVYNLLGQKVLEVFPGVTEAKINMESLSVGSYTVQFFSGNEFQVSKVIKQ